MTSWWSRVGSGYLPISCNEEDNVRAKRESSGKKSSAKEPAPADVHDGWGIAYASYEEGLDDASVASSER